MHRFWIGFGVGTQLVFAVTVVRLVPFLAGTRWPQGGMLAHLGGELDWFWVDAFLALQFCVVRSILLAPGVRSRLRHHSAIPPAHYGTVFRAASCVSLLWTIEVWRPSRSLIWQLQGVAGVAVSAAFVLSAVALLVSGMGGRVGVRGRLLPHWNRSRVPRSVYRLLRRPGDLGCLGLVWFTPVMSLDHATLATIWTVYILFGRCFQERRLRHLVGVRCGEYQGRVPG